MLQFSEYASKTYQSSICAIGIAVSLTRCNCIQYYILMGAEVLRFMVFYARHFIVIECNQ